MELDFFDAWIVGFATLLIVGVSVFTHYEGLTFLSRVINRLTLVGLVLITWSASFTFIEMQKRWET